MMSNYQFHEKKAIVYESQVTWLISIWNDTLLKIGQWTTENFAHQVNELEWCRIKIFKQWWKSY